MIPIFKIGEFSKLTQVSIRMLRYYDEAGLLKPAETDRFTNYRLYSAKQIPTLNKIIFLRDLGFHVAEITLALNQWEDKYIDDLLDRKRREIENIIESEQDKLAKIELAKRDLRQAKTELHYNVAIKSIPSYQVLSLRRIVPDYYAEALLWEEMAVFANRKNIAFANNTFSIYHDPDYKETDVDIEICAPVTQTGKGLGGFTYRNTEPVPAIAADPAVPMDGFTYYNTEPVPAMACTMVYGSFKNIAGAYLSFAGWLQAHSQYRMGGHSRQIVHRGPWNEENPAQYLTEIQIPLEKK